jgi:hypothetical protein
MMTLPQLLFLVTLFCALTGVGLHMTALLKPVRAVALIAIFFYGATIVSTMGMAWVTLEHA